MNDLSKNAISPLAIAQMLADSTHLDDPALAAQITEEPRIPEMLRFLLWVSLQPGSIEKFAAQIIKDCPARFGPACLHDHAAPLTIEQRKKTWNGVACELAQEMLPYESWLKKADEDDCDLFDRRVDNMSIGVYPATKTPDEERRFAALLSAIPRQKFQDVFINAAKDKLAHDLRALCRPLAQRKERRFSHDGPALDLSPWYCEHLAAVLFEAMDLHAGRVELQLARTEVVSLVFDRLDYAWQQKVLVKIEGDARTGKTEAISAWCLMHPGKARLVSTPSGKSCADLHKAIAEAVGLPYGPRTGGTEIKEQIQFIIRHSGIFLIFDESHFLLPVNFDRNTRPARLDWVRTQVIDRKLPVALVTTPQDFKHSADKFQKWTGYNFAQFFGRIMSNVTLPNELSEADLLAVAAVKGPDIPEKFHRFIVARSMQSEGYLKTIEAICTRARYLAQRDNHPTVTLSDVENAAGELIPIAPARPAPAPVTRATVAQPVAVKRGRKPASTPPARSVTPAPALEMPARETTPVLQLATVNK